MLSKRLNAIKNMIPYGTEFVLDIGTDHGLLPIALVKEKEVCKVVGSDIAKSPVHQAKMNVTRHGLESKIDIRQGDGFQVLDKDEQPQVIVIAGMGTETIIDILSRCEACWYNKSNLVLQPMTEPKKLRRFLLEVEYQFSSEKLVKEKSLFYQIIYSTPKDMNHCQKLTDYQYSELELELGPCIINKRDDVVMEYLDDELNKTLNVLKSLKNSSSKLGLAKADEMRYRYHSLLEVRRNVFGS